MVSWNHKLSPTTTLTNSVSFDWFSQDNTAKSQRLFWTVMTGLQSQLSSRLTFNGNVGVDFVNSYQNGVAQPTHPTGAFQPQVGAGTGWVANVSLTYKLLKDTNISLTAANSITPTIGGSLQQSYSFGFGLNHDINQFSNISFATQYSMTNASTSICPDRSRHGGSADFFSASVNYGYRLTRDWRTNLSYTYRDNVDVATSHTILFGLSYDFTVLGNPDRRLIKPERERARQRAQQA